MGMLDRFRGRPRPPEVTRMTVRESAGPLTAREAWELAEPVARDLDPEYRLTMVTSGLDIGPDGRSLQWEFGFDVPGRRATALLTVEPSGEGEDVEHDSLVLVQRLMPAGRSGPHPPDLPTAFRDSPEAVAELAARGVDFVAGPTDMKLEARILSSGEVGWVTYFWDDERVVPFEADPLLSH